MRKRHPHKQNVFLVNITRLGDMLQATPTIAGLKMENPECKVTVLVEKQFEDVCHNIPNIDTVMSLDLGMTVRSLAREGDGIIDAYEYVSEVVQDLRGKNFDYCLNMSSSPYTALLLKLVGITRNGGWTADEEGYRVIESDWAKLFATSVFHQNRQYNSLNLVDVFRCSADVDKHPKQLLIKVTEKAKADVQSLLAQANFQGDGPLVAIQAGASQGKRQWSREKFVRLIDNLCTQLNARVVLTGSKKELAIIDPIKAGCRSSNVFVAAGKTDIPQLAALLEACDILITGDTGPMHMSVAVGTPVIAMFLASAFGFETGPYSEGNIVLQPVIGCGPCNPNKPCAGLECHDTISPDLVAYLTARRLAAPDFEVPPDLAPPSQLMVYRSYFDRFGFCDLKAINTTQGDTMARYREAYRNLWLDDLGDFKATQSQVPKRSPLAVVDDGIEGLRQVVAQAEQGKVAIAELIKLIKDPRSSPKALADTNSQLTVIDREIEQLGYHFGHLGPLTRMFIFAKENLSGSEAISLASQMGDVYESLIRRGQKLQSYLS
ncbi:MAG: hypothetical protein DCC75_00265 [Proteobacteria bacterium]|nr:MAG: hypothetical protein DCC75_00265 [Pseudomonadota bacterium]